MSLFMAHHSKQFFCLLLLDLTYSPAETYIENEHFKI